MLYNIRKVVVGMSVIGSMNHGMLGAEGVTQKLRKTGKKPCSGGDCATDAKSSKAIQVESHTQTTAKMSTMAKMWEHVQTKHLMMMGGVSFMWGIVIIAITFASGVAVGVYFQPKIVNFLKSYKVFARCLPEIPNSGNLFPDDKSGTRSQLDAQDNHINAAGGGAP